MEFLLASPDFGSLKIPHSNDLTEWNPFCLRFFPFLHRTFTEYFYSTVVLQENPRLCTARVSSNSCPRASRRTIVTCARRAEEEDWPRTSEENPVSTRAARCTRRRTKPPTATNLSTKKTLRTVIAKARSKYCVSDVPTVAHVSARKRESETLTAGRKRPRLHAERILIAPCK